MLDTFKISKLMYLPFIFYLCFSCKTSPPHKINNLMLS